MFMPFRIDDRKIIIGKRDVLAQNALSLLWTDKVLMRRTKFSLLSVCLILAACASVSPEDTQMANALCAQGKTLLAAGKTAEALDMYASATNRDDQNAKAWNGLGVANDLLGKHAKALAAYQQAVDLAPDDMLAINNLAHLYLATGDAEDAVRLLQPYADKPNVPLTLRQNLDAAAKAVRLKQEKAGNVYADLGSYPTDGMAQGHLAEVRHLLEGEDGLTLAVFPEVKVSGGTPVFTLKATGMPPQSICKELSAKAFPCVPHEQKP